MRCILPGRIGCAACIANAMRLRTISHGSFPPGGVVGKRCESNYAPATLRTCANVESRWKRPSAGDAEYEKQICTGTMNALFQDRRTCGVFEIALMHTPLLLQCDIFTRFCLHKLPPPPMQCTVYKMKRPLQLEDPLLVVVGVLDNTLGEPAACFGQSQIRIERMPLYSQLDLLLSVLNRVGTVADVAADSEGEVATDGA